LSGAISAADEIWLDASYAPAIAKGDLAESLSLYCRERLGLSISRAEDSVGRGPCPDWAPDVFLHRPGTPLPLISRISLAQSGTSAEASWTWYDPNSVRYVARLK
jgi:GntR family transcriptional regulator